MQRIKMHKVWLLFYSERKWVLVSSQSEATANKSEKEWTENVHELNSLDFNTSKQRLDRVPQDTKTMWH